MIKVMQSLADVFEMDFENYQVIINKETPVRPEYRPYEDKIGGVWQCRRCGEFITDGKGQNHCDHCGQRLEWF